ncbi:MAG: EamA family transporter [Phycisphaerales bacterium]
MMGVLFAVLAGVCWGVGEVFTKSVLHSKQVGPLAAIAVRSAVALPVLWGVWALLWRRLEPVPFWRADGAVLWKLALGSGLIAGAGGMACFYLALHFGEVSRVKPIAFALAPTVAVVVAVAVLGEPLSARRVVAVALIVAGVVLLASSRGSASPG